MARNTEEKVSHGDSARTSKTLVIYNKFNIEAILAAAVISKEIPSVDVIDVTQLLRDEYDTYIWVGVPSTQGTQSYFDPGNKTHVSVNREDDDIPVPTLKDRLKSILRKDAEDAKHAEDGIYVPYVESLICIAAELLGFDVEPYRRLDYQITKFYRKNHDADQIIYCYINAKAAMKYLMTRAHDRRIEYKLIDAITPGHERIYFSDVGHAKRSLQNNYLDGFKVFNSGRKSRVVYTTFQDFTFILARRLIQMTHERFMNIGLGVTGAFLYSNLSLKEEVEFKTQCFLMN